MTSSRKDGAIGTVLLLSSFANIAAGLVLIAAWGINWATDPLRHVPLIVLGIGGPMVIQGLFAAGYVLGWWDAWDDLEDGALLAGQLISGCAGLGLLVSGIYYNLQSPTGDMEMAPVLAGLMIGVNALLGLFLLVVSGKITPTGFSSQKGRRT